ncbi:MAG TPA: ribonuclease P protein component [Chitinophagales bacterium]|nr:ribonuclease P protein component [Chitinophagales bacterium]
MAGTSKHQRLSFTKEERLKSRKRIDELFSEKAFVQNQLIRIYFKQVELNCAFPAQFAFAAPKKIFPNAVDRNRLKRLMRESMRLQKPEFYKILQEKDIQIVLLLSYHAKKTHDYIEVDEAVIKLLKKLVNELG